MSPTEVLHDADNRALENRQVISNVVGKKSKKIRFSKRMKAFGATGVVTLLLVILVAFLGSGFLMPIAFVERLSEVFDVQGVDGIESKIIAFQLILRADGVQDNEAVVPDNTLQRLKENGILVGYEENGEFIESNLGGRKLSVLYNGTVIPESDFYKAVNSDAGLYDAFNAATYSRVAYYYDDTARAVFKRLGTSLNNYSSKESFEETTSRLMGEGNNVNVNNVTLVEKENQDGEIESVYETVGETTSPQNNAEAFINTVASKNKAKDETVATLNAGDTINAANKITEEQRSSLFFLAFMENINKMKAGDGSESQINEAMNLLYKVKKNEVTDVRTGETITVEGSMMDSPSLAAILSGEKLDFDDVRNYSEDRILDLVTNQVGQEASQETLNGTITSTSSKARANIGRYVSSDGAQVANQEKLRTVAPIVENSLINNGFSTIGGVVGGELLVKGAANVGMSLAIASGGTAGDVESVKSYAKVASNVLALEAEADRMSRSPLDISSRNTFLGSLVYKFASFTQGQTGFLGSIRNFAQVARLGLTMIGEKSYADDNDISYLTEFGECLTLSNIGATGMMSCVANITFDSSTLDGILDDPNFLKFIEENTELKNGVRTVKSGSKLANFINYSTERITPIGMTDGGILKATESDSKIGFISSFTSLISNFTGASENNKRIASGAAFVNSSANDDWETYKYAQRYVELARAISMLRMYDGETTAYAGLQYFEGTENPVVAFKQQSGLLASVQE